MWRPELGDYLAVARVVLDLPAEQLSGLPRLELAESALAAPFGGFGGQEAHPTLERKAAVLVERLARNHPLPDGNKRAAFLLMLIFLERNGRGWGATDAAEDGETVRRIAAGELDLDEIVDWTRRRTAAAPPAG
jgi:death-on-curing protein